MKIATILIVKGTADEAQHLERCLKSIAPHVDGVFLNVNYRPPEVIGNPGNPAGEVFTAISETLDKYPNGFYSYIVTEWHDNFAEARNVNLAQVPKDYDWIIWLDVDDTVKNPKKIREVAEASTQYDCLYVDYDYDHDEFGNCTTVHMVGRLFKNNGSHHWNPKTRIHETLVETRSVSQGMTTDFKVIHHAEENRTQESFDRNIKLLESQLKDERKDPDPRTFYYLANAYFDAGDAQSARELFESYLQMSGWDQERSSALTRLGTIHQDAGDTTEARKYFAWAHAEDPNNPDPKVELGSLEASLEQYDKAHIHLEYVLKMKKNLTTLERNPLSYTFRTYLLLANCYLNMGGDFIDKAEVYAQKAWSYKKTDPKVTELRDMVVQINEDRKELTGIITKYMKKLNKGNKKAAQKILDSIPERLADNPIVSQLRQRDKPFKWPRNSIVIMTGDTAVDEWGPWSLKEGIGGSEEAIIRLAPKLAKLGYKVVVFGKPGPRGGLYDDVMWRNYWDCSLEDKFDIFISWRAPFIFDKKIKARKSYLWMHDVMEEGEFTPNRIANFTKCILLSKYHRSLFPMIPDDKVLMSGNGIDPDEFKAYSILMSAKTNPKFNLKRDPRKIFYGSSHVRGLAYIYEIWPEVKKAVPDATLDVYYGRETYDKVHRGNPERLKWMDDLVAKAKDLDGVVDHGKVGQDEIVRHIFESGVWAYPCPFPEIFCITAIKAQAAGCVPVSTNFAALDETVQYGTKIDIPHDGQVGRADAKFLKEYQEKLIWWLQHPKEQEKVRPKMMEWASTKSWDAIAEQWHGEFK